MGRAWYALAILIGATILAYMDRQILALVAQPLQASLAITDWEIGLIQGVAFAFFMAIGSYPMGWLADRYDRRLILAFAVLLWCLSTAAAAFSTSFEHLFIAVVGIALGEAGLSPIVWALIPDVFPASKRVKANLIYFTAAMLGISLGFGLGSGALKAIESAGPAFHSLFGGMEPWRIALLVGAVPAPLFVALILAIRIPARKVTGTTEEALPVLQFLPFAKANWKALAGIFGAALAYNVPLTALTTWLPLAVPRRFGLSSADAGLILSAALFAGTIFGTLGAMIAVRFSRLPSAVLPLRLGRAVYALAAIPTALLPFLPSAELVIAVSGFQCFAMMLSASLMPGVLQEICPPFLRARLIALMAVVTAVGMSITPVLIGFLSPRFGGDGGLLIALAVVGVPFWLAGAALLAWSEKPVVAALASADAETDLARAG